MSSDPVLVIGAGQHGLTAAALLARAGRRVVVCEAEREIGGLGRYREFHPGYRSVGLLHDTACVQPQVIRELRLHEHGLVLRDEPVQVVLTENGPVYLDTEDASGAVSDKDKRAYREYRRFLKKCSKPVGRLLRRPPPSPLGPVSALLGPALAVRGLGASDMVEFLRLPSMCVADWMRDLFESDALSAAIAHSALTGLHAGPWSPWTAANLLFQGAVRGREVSGGPAGLVQALKSACDGVGVTFRLETAVEAILTRSGRVTGVRLQGGEEVATSAVLSTLCPKTTLLGLLGRRYLRDSDAQAVSNIRMRGTTAKAEIALNGLLSDPNGREVERYLSGHSLDALERAFDAAKYGKMSAEPLLDVRVFRGGDNAPPGHSMLSILVHYVPYDMRGGWTHAAREQLGERILEALERAFPQTRARVLAMDVLSPTDIEEQYRLRNGHVFHGEHAPDQLLFMRPTIELANFTTPVGGLTMGGSGNHPGGGITCGAGYLAAKRMLRTIE